MTPPGTRCAGEGGGVERPSPGLRPTSPRSRRERFLLLAALALFAAGCARCGKATPAGAPPVERVLPRGAVGVVVVPSIKGLGDKLRLAERFKAAGFVAQTQGFDDSKALADSLVGELGIDVRDAAALERAGVDASRGLGVGVLVSGDAFVALPVKDEGRVHVLLETVSYRRLGAGAGSELKSGDVVVKTFATQQGQPPRLGYALAHGFALVATEKGVQRLAGLAALPESDSLAADKVLAASLARLPKEKDAFLFLPHGSPVLAKAPVSSALLTAALTPTALTVSADAPWKGDAAQLALLQRKPGPELLGLLPRDAFLVARYAGDPAQLAPFAEGLLGPHLSRAFQQGGFDLKAEVLENLQPGAVAALSLAERPPLDRGLPELDLRRTNPFTWVQLAGVAAPKSADAVRPALDKVAALAPRFGAEMKKVDRDGATLFLTTYSQGEGVHLFPRGERVYFGSPLERVEELAAADGKAGAPVEGLSDDAFALALDLGRLSQAVRALPESAWGLGGFAMKASTVRWLDATDDLKAVTVSAGAKDGAAQARLTLTLELAGAAAP